jgi:hypothetical protein
MKGSDIQYIKFEDAAKVLLRRKFMAHNTYIKNEEIPQREQLIFQLEKELNLKRRNLKYKKNESSKTKIISCN